MTTTTSVRVFRLPKMLKTSVHVCPTAENVDDYECGLVMRVTCGYPWSELEKNHKDFGMIQERLMSSAWRRSFIEPGTGLRMKRTNRRTRVPIGLYPCHIEEKMIVKEVRGESVMKWNTKVTTKEGIVIKLPGRFRGYKLATEEEVEENEGLKEV
uniref:Uncharacterized protein n=1 Tax=Tanacetum cinerariifolium TaxID=118510 RepID=A0A6L2LRK1_TANCI|nr:hypothetical protein [Tanacetum cinerariifolium]